MKKLDIFWQTYFNLEKEIVEALGIDGRAELRKKN